MTQFNQRIIGNKLGLLNLAEELHNVSKACRMMGVSRDTFYRYKARVWTSRNVGVQDWCTMTRVATPENEGFLLMIARHGTARHVEQLVRHYRKVKRTEALERDKKLHERRSLSLQVDDDGMVILKGRFTPEQGASIIQALDKAMGERASRVSALTALNPRERRYRTYRPGAVQGRLLPSSLPTANTQHA